MIQNKKMPPSHQNTIHQLWQMGRKQPANENLRPMMDELV